MTDLYLRFVNGIQAMRRRAEAITIARGGAFGVAADPLPWQLATVERVLGDIEVRHLISDEVGLGKTVQALMIVNALRWQLPGHRTVVVTPEHLLSQWQEECWIRAHVAPAISGTTVDNTSADAPVLLVRPRDLVRGSGSDGGGERILDPVTQDLLIVDEPQTLSIELMDSISNSARDFRQVLVLSASPRLGEAKWRDIVLRMIEPHMAERAALENRSIHEVLLEREAEALAALNGSASSAEARALAFRSAAAGRRIIRNSRSDWGTFLPSRTSREIRVAPLVNDRRMHEIAERLLAGADPQGDMRGQPWTSARGLQRSARTARPILATLAERGGELGMQAEALRLATLEDPGDSRLEALLDLLSASWAKDEGRPFIVVCGDNPTIDLLQGALPRYFPDLEGRISVLRRAVTREESTVASLRDMQAALEPLLERRNPVLLVGDWVQAGLNLHHVADDIVFYSLPWDINAIDQLIGRVDRLRTRAVNRKEKAREVRIWRIVQDGSQEAAVSDALDGFGLFAAPLPPLPETELNALSAILATSATARRAPVGLAALAMDTSGLVSQMAHLDPFTAQAARAGYSTWSAQPLPSPLLQKPHDGNPLRMAEKALSHWLELIRKAEDFDIGSRCDIDNPDFRFRTLWYARRSDNGRAASAPFDLPDTARELWMSDHHPFLLSRRDLPQPPRRAVRTDGGEATERPLRFLDHGEPLHDALVEGYMARLVGDFGSNHPVHEICVRRPAGHPAVELGSQILITACLHDPFPDSWLPPLWSADAESLMAEAGTDAQRVPLIADRHRLAFRLKGLQRLVRLRRKSNLHLLGSRLDGSTWCPIEPEKLGAALRPIFRDGDLRPSARQVPRRLKTATTSALASGRTQQLRVLDLALREARAEDCAAMQEEAALLHTLLLRDAETPVRNRFEAARRRRAQIPENSMRQAWEGQATALERQTRMAQLCAREEVEFLRRFREGLMKAPSLEPASIFLTFVDAEA